VRRPLGGTAGGDAASGHGHRRIGFLGGDPGSAASRDRLAGLRAGLAAGGAAMPTVLWGGWQYSAALAAAEEALAGPDRPDALFCANDIMACAAIDAARRTGRGVPRDLSVLGFDDSAQAGWNAYALTTFRHPVADLARLAVAAVTTADPARPGVTRLRPRLIVRQSVRNALSQAARRE
jgi:DNA-binding LacI/PurR family transcriptional regulator